MIRRFINRLLGRGYVPPHGDGSAHGNWRVGDHAACICDEWDDLQTGEPSANPPTKGEVYVVEGVAFWNGFHILEIIAPGYWATASSFRKVVRDEAKAADECEQLLKVLKRDRVRA